MWDCLNCSLPIEAIASCICVKGLDVTNSHDSFLDTSCTGRRWFIMPRAVECMTHLEHYFRSKRENPVETSALFLLPNVKNAAWSKYTKRMAILGTFSKTAPIFERTSIEEVNGITQTPCGYVMYYDAPHMPAGQFCSSTLPEKARIAHIGPDSPTFIFTGKAAGLHSIFLWDSGAALSFINADYVRRHNIHVNPSNERVMLANGQLVTLRGITKFQYRFNNIGPHYYSTLWRLPKA